MAVTLRQIAENDDNAGSAGTTIAKAFASNTLAGSIIYVMASWDYSAGNVTPTCADTQGNTYSTAQLLADSSSDTQKVCAFWAIGGTTAAADTVTVTWSGVNEGGRCIIIREITGAQLSVAPVTAFTSTPLNLAATTTDSVQTSLVTPPSAGDNLVIADVFNIQANVTAPALGTGYTDDGTFIQFGHGVNYWRAEHLNITGTGTQVQAKGTPTSATSARYTAHVAVFGDGTVATTSDPFASLVAQRAIYNQLIRM
jgi:hypothetical protein